MSETDKKTKYQPTMDEWKCPRCGSDDFIVDEGPYYDYPDDDDLYEEDKLYCESCGFEIIGEKFSKLMENKKTLVKCPHCEGAGVIESD